MTQNHALPHWSPPSTDLMTAAHVLLGPWRMLTAPVFRHAERVPRDRPVMFIGNHTLMGMVDTPLLMLGIHEHTGHFPRSMGDDFHFNVPGWRDLLRRFGTVPGSRDNCRQVMGQGHSLLVFPGGGREVFKRKGEQYQLIWKKRSGFARLAREQGYAIVPVASVGAEECYRILFDESDLAGTWLGEAARRRAPRADVTFPTVVAGMAGTPLPIPRRFYFQFGEPIESEPYRQRDDEEDAIFALREEVRCSLEAQIAELLEVREQDPDRSLGARIRNALGLSGG